MLYMTPPSLLQPSPRLLRALPLYTSLSLLYKSLHKYHKSYAIYDAFLFPAALAYTSLYIVHIYT